MTPPRLFRLGDVVELTSEGQAWLRRQSERGFRPPGSDPKRGVVKGFSPRHPELMHVLRDGYRTALLTKVRYWTKVDKSPEPGEPERNTTQELLAPPHPTSPDGYCRHGRCKTTHLHVPGPECSITNKGRQPKQ